MKQINISFKQLFIKNPITRSKLVEEALRESRLRLTDITEFLPRCHMGHRQGGQDHSLEPGRGVKAEEMFGKGDYEYALPFYGERRPIPIDLILMPRGVFLGNIFLSKLYTQDDKVIERLTCAETACNQAKELTACLITFSRGSEPLRRIAPIAPLVKDAVQPSPHWIGT